MSATLEFVAIDVDQRQLAEQLFASTRVRKWPLSSCTATDLDESRL